VGWFIHVSSRLVARRGIAPAAMTNRRRPTERIGQSTILLVPPLPDDFQAALYRSTTHQVTQTNAAMRMNASRTDCMAAYVPRPCHLYSSQWMATQKY
jgi:hypothetical protein